jgi:hypothetical protein
VKGDKVAVAAMDEMNVKARLLDLDFFLLCTSIALFGNAVIELTGLRLF